MQGKVEPDLVASRIIPVSHPAAGLVSRDYVEEGDTDFVDLHAQAAAAAKAAEEKAKKAQAEKKKQANEPEVVEDVDAFLRSLEEGGGGGQ